MAQFRRVVELVLRNDGSELDRVEIQPEPVESGCVTEYVNLQDYRNAANRDLVQLLSILRVGDTITIEERETEVE